jgi:hypothetical protein
MSKITFNCSCGVPMTLPADWVYSALYNYRAYNLACDICNRIPNINYGGMEA